MKLTFLFLTIALAGCATTGTTPSDPDDNVIEVPPGGECDAAGVQNSVGERATAELGGAIRAATKSDSLRWIPPRSAVTQDYRADRVNVTYDDDYVIERIYCG